MLTARGITGLVALVALASPYYASAFVVTPGNARKSTSLFLEDWVANLIDDELYRETHIEEFESKWMEKNRNQVLQHVPTTVLGDEGDMADFRQLAKDKKLARTNPQSYCADRCVATGNCEIYEDIFELSPQEVLSFCNDCVLNEGEDPDSECVIPDAFYELGDLSP